MIKVKQKGQESLKTRLHPDEADHLILVEEEHLKTIIDEANLWTERDFIMELDPYQKIMVENYYGGYLDYYDEQVRSGLVEHDIHFDWSLEDGRSRVKVYIWPAPVKTNKMVGSFTKKKEDESKGVESTQSQDSSLAPPPATGTSDPPDPQSPPHGS